MANDTLKIVQRADSEENKVSSLFEDGGEVTLTCSECDKPLVVIWRTRPNEKLKKKPVEWKVKAKCPYCGDFSFTKKIIGGFHHKGFDKPHPNGNPEDVIAFVNVTDINTEGDEVIFNTEKVNDKSN